MKTEILEIPAPWPELMADGICHPQLYLWDAWSYLEGDDVHLYCLAVNRKLRDGSTLAPQKRNAYQFHIRHFLSVDEGQHWRDCGALQTPGQAVDRHDARNIWSGSVLRLPDGGVLSAYTGIRESGGGMPFVQTLGCAYSADGYSVEPGAQTLLSCPRRDSAMLREAGYYFASDADLGSDKGEEGGPILAWRDPYCFIDTLAQSDRADASVISALWAAKADCRRPAIGWGELEKQDDQYKMSKILPPITLPDDNLYSQIECPKVIFDTVNQRYLLLVATATRFSEDQPDSEISKKIRLYYSVTLSGPWHMAGTEQSDIAGLDNLFGMEVIRADFVRGALLCMAPYTEMAGPEKMLGFAPPFWLDITQLGKTPCLSA